MEDVGQAGEERLKFFEYAADGRRLISLKRYLDADQTALLIAALESYRAAILAAGAFGAEACPHLGPDFVFNLRSLEHRLDAETTPAKVTETQQKFEAELQQSSARAAKYLKDKAEEIKDLLLVMARTSESMGERDLRYGRQFDAFTSRLEKIAELEDLTRIRASLVQSAHDLKSCVDKMAEESRDTIVKLRAEVSAVQTRMEETEKIAGRDPLTGLVTRRRIEMELEDLEERQRPFCVVLIDVNRLQQVNFDFGHPAGDQVLRQFATELKSALRTTDLVGRWGDDEFLAVLDCNQKQAETQIDRMRQWVFGDYTIDVSGAHRKIRVNAAIGMSAWTPGEPVGKAIERADQALHRDKARAAAK